MADNNNQEDAPDNRVSSKNADGRNEASSDLEPAQATSSFSQASQVGRARTGGSPDSALRPGESTREGWDVPDQSDTPLEWPEPTID